MRHPLIVVLAGTLLLAACQAPGIAPAAKKPTKSDTKVTRASIAPSLAPSTPPSASTSPTSLTSAAPSSAPSASIAPSIPTTALSGVVKIDAHYMVASGGGSVIATGGGNFIATNGGTVISVGGGNVISVGGGNVISVGGGNYRTLADTVVAPEEVAVGTMLPIRGMAVVPVSLTTGQPLGPAVLTNEKGEYTLDIPETHKDNIVVYATVPGKTAQDPLLQDARLSYNLVVTPSKAEESQALDEDTSLASSYVLKCFVSRMKDIMTADDARMVNLVDQVTNQWGVVPALQVVVENMIRSLNKDAREAGITASYPDLDGAADAVLKATLAHMDNLYTLELDYAKASLDGVGTATGPKEPALQAMVDSLRLFRGVAQTRLRDNPQYFTNQTYLTEANQALPEGKKYLIKRPSDLGEFLIVNFLSVNDASAFPKLYNVLLSLMPDEPARASKEYSRLRAASVAIVGELGLVMAKPEAQEAQRAAIKAHVKATLPATATTP